MRARTARRPPVMRCRKAARWPVDHLRGEVRRDHRHDGDRDHAVGELEEGVGVGVRRDRVGPGHAAGQHGDDEEGDLVGQRRSRRSSRPGGPRRAARRRAGSSASAGGRGRRGAGWAPSATPWSTTPREVPRPSRTSWEWWASTLASEAPWPAHRPNQTRMPMHTMLFTIGAQATATKLAAGVEQRGAEGEEAVGGDLDHEPAQELGGHLALEVRRGGAGAGGRGCRAR